jgi:hypothetical protein
MQRQQKSFSLITIVLKYAHVLDLGCLLDPVILFNQSVLLGRTVPLTTDNVPLMWTTQSKDLLVPITCIHLKESAYITWETVLHKSELHIKIISKKEEGTYFYLRL